jgi:hypothetical protein
MHLHQVPKLWRRKDTIRDMDSRYVVPHLPRLFCAHTLHPATLRTVWIFCHPLFMAPFTSNLDTPSGCLGGMCSLTTPPPHSHWPVPSIFKLFPFFLTTPFTAHCLVALSIHLNFVIAFRRSTSFRFGASALCIFLSEYPCLFFWISMWSMLSPFSSYQTSLDLQLSRLEALGAMLLPSSSAVAL